MVNILLTKAIPFAEKSGDTALAGQLLFRCGHGLSPTNCYTLKQPYYFNKALEYFKINKPALKDEVMTLLHAARSLCLMDSLKDAKPLLESVTNAFGTFPVFRPEYRSQYHGSYLLQKR